MEDATARLAAVCQWLFRHPKQVRAAHLQAGTHLGLVVSLLAHSLGAQPLSPPWTDALEVCRTLNGASPEAAAIPALNEMRRLGQWVHDQIRPARPATGARRAGLDRLGQELPLLAELLRRGADTAARRGDLFLQRRPASGEAALVDGLAGRRWLADRQPGL